MLRVTAHCTPTKAKKTAKVHQQFDSLLTEYKFALYLVDKEEVTHTTQAQL